MGDSWKPTQPGLYRSGNTIVSLRSNGVLCLDTHPGSTSLMFGNLKEWVECQDVTWSLIGPDRQSGAPTSSQVQHWPWWAVVTSGGDMVAGLWHVPHYYSKLSLELATPNGRLVAVEHVTWSAPIQSDMADGLLWVPRTVAQGAPVEGSGGVV